MKLSTAALAAAFAMYCTFALRTVATLQPELLSNLTWAKFAAAVRILAGAVQVAFFAVFLRDYVRGQAGPLRDVTLWAMAGLTIALLPAVKRLVLLSHVYPDQSLFRSNHLEAVAPLVGSIAMLAFFCVLRQSLLANAARNHGGLLPTPGPVSPAAQGSESRLLRPTTFAAVGSGVFVCLNAVAAAGYFATGQLRWLKAGGRPVAWLAQTVVIIAFAALVWFFFALFRDARDRQAAATRLSVD